MSIKFLVVTVSIVFSIIFDSALGVSEYPVITLVVCAIVFLYEYLSPFIYSSR